MTMYIRYFYQINSMVYPRSYYYMYWAQYIIAT